MTKKTSTALSFVCLLYMATNAPACAPVKEYQKSKINDAEMELSARKVQRFEQNFQAYREGASGANGGKTGGGCGCN